MIFRESLCLRNLIEESVQHAHTEHLPSSKRQAEHKHQIGTLLFFFLQTKPNTQSLFHSGFLRGSEEFVVYLSCSCIELDPAEGNATLENLLLTS